MSSADYDTFCHNLLTDQDWLAKGGTGSTSQVLKIAENSATYSEKINAWAKLTEEQRDHWRSCSYKLSTLVYAKNRAAILVNGDGCSYARYVGFIMQSEAAKYTNQNVFEFENVEEAHSQEPNQETLDILADCERLSAKIEATLKKLSERA